VIGLTGGIASGKSTVANLLRARGAVIVDADQLARAVVEPGQPALAELVARFGAAILAADGSLDRKRLGAIAFADPQARADLDRITHPRIAAASAAAIAAAADAGANVVFYEAALLVENRIHLGLAGLIVVSASAAQQEARLIARDGLAVDEARARIAAQLPLADKLAAATWVIENGGEPAAVAAEVTRVVVELEARFGSIKLPAPAPRPSHPGARAIELVTGFPAFTARRMIAKRLARGDGARLVVLARAKFAQQAAAFLAATPGGDRAEVVIGDVCDMDLGLTSAEYRALTHELTWIHHLAGIYFMGADDKTARLVNVSGTRTVLELAKDATRLERLVHWSTAMVSGTRRGSVREDELDAGQKFRNAYERTKFDAEKLVHAAGRGMPITVLRPSIIVGDSQTGEIDKLDGPYYLMVLVATNASGLRLPLLGRADVPLHLVPIDYVIDAAAQIVRRPDSAGKTYHLVDPAPMTAEAFFDAVADHAHTEKPRGRIPGPLARAVMSAPGLSRFARGPRTFLDVLEHPVRYEQTNTAAALGGSGIVCPPLAEYLPVLVDYARSISTRATRPSSDDIADPLA
jgi:dephospho-CoA kinase